MAFTKTMTGTGTVTDSDFLAVSWIGRTKSGGFVEIKLDKAINMGNIDWAMVDKDDVVQEVVFTSVYAAKPNGVNASDVEPWEVTYDTEKLNAAGSGDIMLGAGVFKIGDHEVGLTRGGGRFTVEREFREIKADGDRGPVEGRITMDGSRATLTMNVLQILGNIASIYPAVVVQDKGGTA